MTERTRYIKYLLIAVFAFACPPASAQDQSCCKAGADSLTVDSVCCGRDSVSCAAEITDSLTWLIAQADSGNADAIGQLARRYEIGDGVEPDSLKAAQLYVEAIKHGNAGVIPMHDKLAREQHSVFSALFLHDIYTYGKGVRRNFANAAEYLGIAAESGHAESMFSYALGLYNNKKYDESALWFKNAAESGNVSAAYLYGHQVYQGMGVAQDKAEGIKFIEEAAKKDHNVANYEMGRVILSGELPGRDASEAVEFLEKAAPAYRQAAWLLGACCKDGRGTAVDYDRAVHWMVVAFDDGKATREKIQKMLADDGDGPFTQYLRGLYRLNIDRRPEEAQTWFGQVAKAGIADGEVMTALCMVDTLNAKPDGKKAVKTLQKHAAEKVQARYFLYRCYDNGWGVKTDKSLAMEWLTQAVESGYGSALCEMADKYMEGEDVGQDLTKAAGMYLQAERLHYLSPASAKNLARCYEMKVTSLPDLDKAESRVKELKSLKESTNFNLFISQVSFNQQ